MKNIKLSFSLLLVAFVYVTGFGLSPGKYYIQSANDGKYMDVKDANKANTTPLHIWPFNGPVAQIFNLEEADGEYFYIKSDLGKYIHIQNRSDEPMDVALIWSGKGNENTQWKFHPTADGYFHILSKEGTYLDVQWGKSKNGTPEWLSTKNSGNAQKWKLKPIKQSANKCYGKLTFNESFKIGAKCISSKYGHLLNKSRHFDSKVILNGKVELYVEKGGRSISAVIEIEMKGTKPKSAHVKAKWIEKDVYKLKTKDQIITSANYSYSFKNISLPEGGSEFGFCNDGDVKKIQLTSNKKTWGHFKIIGDTGAEDISNDGDCRCDSKLVGIDFVDVPITVQCKDLPPLFDINDLSTCATLMNRHKKNYLLHQNNKTWLEKNSFENNNRTRKQATKLIFKRVNKESKYFKIISSTDNQHLGLTNGKPTFKNSTIGDDLLWYVEHLGYKADFGFGYRIRNKRNNEYLHTEHGKLGMVKTPGSWWSTIWLFDSCDNNVLL